jgi:RHS repeat-associated protein
VDDGSAVANVGYQFDAAGRLTSETSAGLTHTHEYDLAGRCTQTTLGTGRVVTRAVDGVGRMTALQEGGRTTQYAYDGNGNIIKKTLPNGEEVFTSYDALNRQRQQTVKAGAVYLLNQAQYYDRTGNVRVTEEIWPGASSKDRRLELSYDGAQRLQWERSKSWDGANSQWVDAGKVKFEYDNAHNRTWKKRYGAAQSETAVPAESWQSTYNALNQLTVFEHFLENQSADVATYAYDEAGNRRSRTRGEETIWYGYDREYRLLEVARQLNEDPPVESAVYAYDYRGRCVRQQRQTSSGNEDFSVSFDGSTSVAEMPAAGGAALAEYVRGADWGGGVHGLLYSLRPNLGTMQPHYNHYNGRGDVVLQTNASAANTWDAAYEAFGKRIRESGTNPDRQRANTKEENSFGLLNEGHRYRDLETGVWLTRDPAGFVDGPNLYAYVRQNPWSSFDPLGLQEYNWWAGGWLRTHMFDPVYNTVANIGSNPKTVTTGVGTGMATGMMELSDLVNPFGVAKRALGISQWEVNTVKNTVAGVVGVDPNSQVFKDAVTTGEILSPIPGGAAAKPAIGGAKALAKTIARDVASAPIKDATENAAKALVVHAEERFALLKKGSVSSQEHLSPHRKAGRPSKTSKRAILSTLSMKRRGKRLSDTSPRFCAITLIGGSTLVRVAKRLPPHEHIGFGWSNKTAGKRRSLCVPANTCGVSMETSSRSSLSVYGKAPSCFRHSTSKLKGITCFLSGKRAFWFTTEMSNPILSALKGTFTDSRQIYREADCPERIWTTPFLDPRIPSWRPTQNNLRSMPGAMNQVDKARVDAELAREYRQLVNDLRTVGKTAEQAEAIAKEAMKEAFRANANSVPAHSMSPAEINKLCPAG